MQVYLFLEVHFKSNALWSKIQQYDNQVFGSYQAERELSEVVASLTIANIASFALDTTKLPPPPPNLSRRVSDLLPPLPLFFYSNAKFVVWAYMTLNSKKSRIVILKHPTCIEELDSCHKGMQSLIFPFFCGVGGGADCNTRVKRCAAQFCS